METKCYLFYVLTSDIAPEEIRYVGVTTQTLSRRFIQHKYCATHPEKRGLPVHKWMYSVYSKGGKINITQIDECGESEWEEREQSLISKYREQGCRLLNIDKGGKGVITAEKRSIDSITRSTNAHKVPITAFNLDGTKYKDFDSIVEAARELGGKSTNIGSVLNGWSKSACGYMWKYKTDETNINTYEKESIGIKVYQFDLEGNFIKEFSSKKEVADSLGVKSQKALTRAISNRTCYKRSFWSTDRNANNFISPFKYIVKWDNEVVKVIEQKEIAKLIGMSLSFVNQRLQHNSSFIHNKYIVETI